MLLGNSLCRAGWYHIQQCKHASGRTYTEIVLYSHDLISVSAESGALIVFFVDIPTSFSIGNDIQYSCEILNYGAHSLVGIYCKVLQLLCCSLSSKLF